jgi:hypothetical protein
MRCVYLARGGRDRAIATLTDLRDLRLRSTDRASQDWIDERLRRIAGH